MWRDIPGYEGYQASEDGRIRNRRKRRLKQRLNNGSYLVDLGGRTARVHNLVAAAHYGSPTCPGYFVRHRSEDKSDNSAENLMYAGGKPRRLVHKPVGEYCRNGHPLTGDNIKRWGTRGNNRICIACQNGEPPVREIREII